MSRDAVEEPAGDALEESTDHTVVEISSELAGAPAVEPVASLDELDRRNYAQDIVLKRVVAGVALGVVVVQVGVADVVFWQYGRANAWDIPASAIYWWLGATVVEVIAVLLVITRYLFPSPGK